MQTGGRVRRRISDAGHRGSQQPPQGLPPYTSLWPELTGHTIRSTEQSNTYPYWDLLHKFEYIVNSILHHIEMSQSLYNSHNSGNSKHH